MTLLFSVCIIAMCVLILHTVALRPARPSFNNPVVLHTSAGLSLLVSCAHVLLQSSAYILSSAVLAVLTYIGAYSVYSDCKYRRVDRQVLRAGLVLVAVFSIVFYVQNPVEHKIVATLVAFFIAASTFFVPSLGASDTRAFVLVSVAGSVFLSWGVFYAGLIAVSVSVVVGCIFLAIKNRSLKVNVPLVPFIVFPFVPAWFIFDIPI